MAKLKIIAILKCNGTLSYLPYINKSKNKILIKW